MRRCLGLLWLACLALTAPQMLRAQEERPLRIVTFGSSLTANYDWPDRLAGALTTCSGQQVHVTKIAMPGADVSWALTQTDRVLAADPDMVLIEFAINDADIFDGLWLGSARQAYDTLLTRLGADLPDARLVLMSMSPAQGPRGWKRPRLARHYAQQGEIADAYGLEFIDIHARWQALPRAQRGLERDGLHPDKEVAAQVILPALTQRLAPGCGS